MITHNSYSSNIIQGKQRVSWIDVAKGIAMTMVIIGHTVERDSVFWMWCISVSMPMFFILSGYTSSVAKDWSTFWKRLKKNFVHLIIPCIVLWIMRAVKSNIHIVGKSTEIFVNAIGVELQKLFWASGATNAEGTIPALGALWFLIAMFYAKTLWDIICILFPKANSMICVFVGLLGVVIGQRMYLPQEMDVVLLVVFFLSFGKSLKKINECKYYDTSKNILALVCFSVWMICLHFGIRIEIAWRDYQYGIISILESCCATIFMCVLSQEIDGNLKCRKLLMHLGTNTLWIFMVHCMDSVLSVIWKHGPWYIQSCLRVVVDVMIALVIAWIKDRQVLKKGVAVIRKRL